jgi:hypothetical protein
MLTSLVRAIGVGGEKGEVLACERASSVFSDHGVRPQGNGKG